MSESNPNMIEIVRMFSNEREVEAMFVKARWPDGVACCKCGSLNVQERPSRKPQPFRCRDCRNDFSVKSNTVMHGSTLPLSKWAMAIYLLVEVGPKGYPSTKLSEMIGVRQRTAWFMGHRIRAALESEDGNMFEGPVEVDETYIGGAPHQPKPDSKSTKHSPLGDKTCLVGMKDRATKQVVTQVIPDTKRKTLHGFIKPKIEPRTYVFTDGLKAYQGLVNHDWVNHSNWEYVYEDKKTGHVVHTNGIEGYWSTIKRGIMGTYHYISPQHTHRYAAEFEWRFNNRRLGVLDRIRMVIHGMSGKGITFNQLTGR